MDRKSFLRNSALGAAGIAISQKGQINKDKTSTYDKLMDKVGYNHLPNKENITMNSVLHRAETRGNANHGWLNSHHTFSFANYHNPDRMNFGILRVLNDDVVAPGRGFGKHPHDNMEIISIPLSGDLEHQDSMGNATVIKQGDIQVMSAGTGVQHSEYNKNTDQDVKFLQIWLFPNKKNVTPRYYQITLDEAKSKNNLQQILSPNADDEGVWIHQNAWFHMGDFDDGFTTDYVLKDRSNGLYVFVLEGNLDIEGQDLHPRDGYGLWNIESASISSRGKTKVLLMEVPMTLA